MIVKPVHQTIFGPPYGNCLQACIASILELELDDVPNFMESGDDWQVAYFDFMEMYGLLPLFLSIEGMREVDLDWVPPGWHLVSGVSLRHAPYHHEIIALKGKPVHDPYPDGDCELKTREHWTVFISTLDEGSNKWTGAN